MDATLAHYSPKQIHFPVSTLWHRTDFPWTSNFSGAHRGTRAWQGCGGNSTKGDVGAGTSDVRGEGHFWRFAFAFFDSGNRFSVMLVWWRGKRCFVPWTFANSTWRILVEALYHVLHWYTRKKQSLPLDLTIWAFPLIRVWEHGISNFPSTTPFGLRLILLVGSFFFYQTENKLVVST